MYRGVCQRSGQSLYYRFKPVYSRSFNTKLSPMLQKMKDSSQEASDILIEHWQKGTTLKELPENLRPNDSSHGYDIQQHILRLTSKYFTKITFQPKNLDLTSSEHSHLITCSDTPADRSSQTPNSQAGRSQQQAQQAKDTST